MVTRRHSSISTLRTRMPQSYSEKLVRSPGTSTNVYSNQKPTATIRTTRGRYDSQNIQLPIISSFLRFSLFQLGRPKNETLEHDFFYQTCRLAVFLRLDITDQTNLKKKLLTLICQSFNKFTESDNFPGK